MCVVCLNLHRKVLDRIYWHQFYVTLIDLLLSAWHTKSCVTLLHYTLALQFQHIITANFIISVLKTDAKWWAYEQWPGKGRSQEVIGRQGEQSIKHDLLPGHGDTHSPTRGSSSNIMSLRSGQAIQWDSVSSTENKTSKQFFLKAQ